MRIFSPLLFPLMAVLIWATNTVVSKAAAGVVDPAAISFYRWVLAALALSPFCLPQLWRRRAEVRLWLGKLLVLSLLGMVLYQCLAYYAAHSTSATNMGVIGSLLPLLTLLIGACFFGQRPGKQALGGMSVSLFGVFWLLSQGQPLALLHNGINPGDGMMLLGAASYALYGLLIRRWQLPFGPWLNLYVQILLAVLLLIPVALSADSLAVPREGWSMVLFAGLASSLLAAYCWMRGLASLGPERTSVFMNLIPLFTAMIAVSSLGEPIHGYHLLGGGLILGGVMCSQFKPRRRAPQLEGA
ncbi:MULTISPECIES: DMT family transporter [Aeromonas]|uniref:DMT family transporter n=1 Tax=Aeromonas encheleia TaxID=73010 RepID=A0AAE9SBD1_9GAMM|nr:MULTISPECIES: DMT family transporter [Aeromonas]MBV7414572.1 DMT family transporter [Aeromonas sp. sif2433]MBV7597612.1 DMT family transporter [Aeromonas sp. sia0103]UNP89399.1 DMT family transporter [Aeromonas encheleia]USV56645.1 DMT family transporter [Aeromonas encheleia]